MRSGSGGMRPGWGMGKWRLGGCGGEARLWVVCSLGCTVHTQEELGSWLAA